MLAVELVCLQLKLEAKCTKFVLPVDIVIGTVPLRETVMQGFVAPSQLNTDFTGQLPPPSAPPITDLPDNFSARMSYLLTHLLTLVGDWRRCSVVYRINEVTLH